MAIPLTHSLNNVQLDDVEHCQALQEEELEVLQSIFPEYVYSKSSSGILKLEIPIEFATPQVMSIVHVPHCPSSSQVVTKEQITVSVLPPIILHITLLPSYPVYGPPKIISLQATHQWLEDVESIKDSLLKIYEPGEHTLYNWIEYLRGGEFLIKSKTSGLEDEINGLSHDNPELLASTLSDFETSYKLIRFSQNCYPCSICLTSLKGTKCHRLQCSHIFCRECLEDFWTLCITERNIGRVGCPDPDCVKEGKESCEEEVAMIVTSSELKRWKGLRKRRELERDPTTVRCPRMECHYLVAQPRNVDPESGWVKFRQCSRCKFSFCAICRRGWHGLVSPCSSSFRQKFIHEYLATEKGSAERAKLELRYGRSFIQRAMTQYKEEQANDRWISSSATPCPGCRSPVEKSEGCNHMTCSRCSQHFCYRCGDKLDASQPIAHFSVANSRCYQKLFESRDGRNDWH